MAQMPPGQGDEKRRKPSLSLSLCSLKGKYMDIEFDFKGSPLGGVITNCTCLPPHSPPLTRAPWCPLLLIYRRRKEEGWTYRLPNRWQHQGLGRN